MPDGLLVHLVDQFVTRREQVATAGLSYLAREYPPVREVLGALSAVDPADRDRLLYRPEAVAADAQGRPDIVGERGGERWVVVEGKFWAKLTDAQPCGYLRGVSEGGVVLFLCPSSRIEPLCAELAERVRQEGLGYDEFTPDGTGLQVMTTSGRRHLVVASWPVLLRRIRAAAAGDFPQLDFEVDQLEGLVGRLEKELVEWSRAELEQGVTRGTFRKAVTTAELLFDGMDRDARTTRTGNPKWVDRNGVHFRARYAVGGLHLYVGYEPEKWSPDFPTPLTFGIWSPDVPQELKQPLHRAYSGLAARIWAASDFPGPGFTPAHEGATWWWGPIPVAADRPADETRARLTQGLDELLGTLDALR
ncbi:hypothetical protein GCM10018781_62670 [Kitasatospora indigofera]|uniref:PD-(D/E)XK nuclease superfamily protein n=1 Tax=Kitasatospora indigofera TaxID=67307 RepID=A0A919L208_9ACTN|nr:hypothetical protein GCM10018781_62670 [Kitasatospora indigofera]